MRINDLLMKRNCSLLGEGGSVENAMDRHQHSKYIAENFDLFDEVRKHLINPAHNPRLITGSRLSEMMKYLEALDWIVKEASDKWVINNSIDIRGYLSGGWLEEYIFMAHMEVGVDEAYFSQEISWNVDGFQGKNEVDVIARKGNVLSFTSCKAINLFSTAYRNAQLRSFLTETSYWNTHFANGEGKALLIITADLWDELNNCKPRHPEFFARANILDVSVAGYESIKWDNILSAIEGHWKNNE